MVRGFEGEVYEGRWWIEERKGRGWCKRCGVGCGWLGFWACGLVCGFEWEQSRGVMGSGCVGLFVR